MEGLMSGFKLGLCAFSVLGVLAVTGHGAPSQTKPPATDLKLALQPLTTYANILIARDKGFFLEENLNVSWTTVSQGAWTVEAVYGGSVQFGGSGLIEPMIARGNGLDLMLAVANGRIQPKPPDNNALLVRTGDTITKAADLAGKTVAAGLINSPNYLHMVHWLKKAGVDPKSVRFIELPFPQM